MRTTIAWSAALFALVEIVPTSWGSPISRTENTEPCAVIHALQELWTVANNETKSLEIDATLASKCLRSVPLNVTDELVKLEEIGKYLQFQSTIEWAANPPKTGLYREPVNLMSGLEEIKAKVRAEEYEGAYQVAEAIRQLLRKVRDGHLKWKSPCLEGSFSFFHKFPIIHLWDDTGGFGKIYAANDFMDREELKKGMISRSPNNTKPVSAISTIAGEPAFDYLERFVEREAGSFHDPDARWNSLFAARQGGSITLGTFAASSLIPEPLSFEIGFENGTSRTIDWKAKVVGNFVNTTSGGEYYQNHCTAFEPIVAEEEEETTTSIQQPPSIFENVTERVPGYPIPLAKAHNNMLSSYILRHPTSPTTLTGVLAIHTFLALNESPKFSDFVIDTLNTFHQNNVSNLIIDVSGNGGGNVALGYSTFAQLFPQLNPSATTNMRAHPFAEFLASDAAFTLQALSSNPSTTPEEMEYAVSTPFCFAPQQSLSGGSFPDWRSAYGPIDIRGDYYTNYMRWNLNAPEFNITHSDAGQRWDASQIVVLGDGMCSSTCTLFVSAMVNAGVRTVAYGGRPNRGTMQIIGGVEGSQVLTFEELWSLGESAVQNAVWREYANTNATTNSTTTSTNATSSSSTINPTITKKKLTNLRERVQESRLQKRSSSPTSSFAPELPASLESVLPHLPTRKLRGNGVVNLRNAFDAHWDVPREFVYRASDYRVPVTAEEWTDVERLWRKVVGEVWYV